jgi:hypothetical protein
MAVPFIEGHFHNTPDAIIEGDHKTEAGRENYIRSHGQPGVEYAVALLWPTGQGWVPAATVTVPMTRVTDA